jgi:hypothetical protein
MATVLQLAGEMKIKKASMLQGFQSGVGKVFARSDAIALQDVAGISRSSCREFTKTGRNKPLLERLSQTT